MNIVLIAIVIFILTLAAGYAGMQVQTQLSPAHKTGESRGVVGQVAGLLTLLLQRSDRHCRDARRHQSHARCLWRRRA